MYIPRDFKFYKVNKLKGNFLNTSVWFRVLIFQFPTSQKSLSYISILFD